MSFTVLFIFTSLLGPKLSKDDISVLRRLHNPPEAVKDILKTTLLLLGHPEEYAKVSALPVVVLPDSGLFRVSPYLVFAGIETLTGPRHV